MELQEFIAQSSEVVNELSRAIKNRKIGLREVEERILQFVNRMGDLMVQKVLEGVNELFTENRVWVQGAEAVFDQVRTLRFRNRFTLSFFTLPLHVSFSQVAIEPTHRSRNHSRC